MKTMTHFLIKLWYYKINLLYSGNMSVVYSLEKPFHLVK